MDLLPISDTMIEPTQNRADLPLSMLGRLTNPCEGQFWVIRTIAILLLADSKAA